MRAMVLSHPGQPLQLTELMIPRAATGQVLVKVAACAVCRTDLHIVDGELTRPKLPLIPGHEIVGRVQEVGAGAGKFQTGDRVGIPWLAGTCGECSFCRSQRENLCERALFTGYTVDGGYADYISADARFCFPVPEFYGDIEAAPLLCAGLIGYRSLLKAGDAERLGIFGFGSAAHIVTQVARHQGREVFAFTRPGDTVAREFALSLGAVWAGDSSMAPPQLLDAAIIFAPVGSLVPHALRVTAKGGTVVCGGIHMTDIPSFPYELLWHERTICSVANLTRRDAEQFLELTRVVRIRTTTESFALSHANEALHRLRNGQARGTPVLVM